VLKSSGRLKVALIVTFIPVIPTLCIYPLTPLPKHIPLPRFPPFCLLFTGGDWKCGSGKHGTVENAGVENAGVENVAPDSRGGKRGSKW